MKKITSLEQLDKWNSNPTTKKPIVMEWFLDWIIDKCPKKYLKFKEAMNVFTKFTVICNKQPFPKAFDLVVKNLTYWYARSSKKSKRFKNYFNKLLVEYKGIR